MKYRIIAHTFLGTCTTYTGRLKAHCYGNRYLLYASKYMRHQHCAFRLSTNEVHLSMNVGNGKFVRTTSVRYKLKDENEK